MPPNARGSSGEPGPHKIDPPKITLDADLSSGESISEEFAEILTALRQAVTSRSGWNWQSRRRAAEHILTACFDHPLSPYAAELLDAVVADVRRETAIAEAVSEWIGAADDKPAPPSIERGAA